MSVFYFLALVHPILAIRLLLKWKKLEVSQRLAVPIYIASMPVTVLLYLFYWRHAPTVLFSLPILALVVPSLIWDVTHWPKRS